MKHSLITAALLGLIFAVANAQTKVSGTSQCGKPDQDHVIQIGDRPNHAFDVGQGKCTYTKPFQIAGTQSKEDLWTSIGEMDGDKMTYRGYFTGNMANGDKAHYRLEGSQILKDGIPQSGKETWTLIGGTGKLKGAKGKGTATLRKATADGISTWDLEGEFELPK